MIKHISKSHEKVFSPKGYAKSNTIYFEGQHSSMTILTIVNWEVNKEPVFKLAFLAVQDQTPNSAHESFYQESRFNSHKELLKAYQECLQKAKIWVY